MRHVTMLDATVPNVIEEFRRDVKLSSRQSNGRYNYRGWLAMSTQLFIRFTENLLEYLKTVENLTQ